MKLEDQIRRLIALKKEVPPPPTLLEKQGGVKDDYWNTPAPGICGLIYPIKYHGYPAGRANIYDVYEEMITFMYCRDDPTTEPGCYPLYLNPENEGPSRVVTTRDQPLALQRRHPEFNPDDQSTWGPLFGPGGYVEGMLKYHHGGSGSVVNHDAPGWFSDEDISAMVDIIRQLYAMRCRFVVAQGGSCCIFDDFGGAMCRDAISAETCEGVFTLGGSCGGANPCGGLASNLIEINDQVK